jgi:type I restriction enzyme M protein
MKPDPRVRRDFTICDPACGTGGFLVAAYEWLKSETKGGALDRDVARRIRTATYFGQDLVDRPRRMALMNLYLHNIEPQIKLGGSIYEPAAARRFDVVLTNPPFGTTLSIGNGRNGQIARRSVHDQARSYAGCSR